MSRGTVTVVAAAVFLIGAVGYWWSHNVLWVLLAFGGIALKINDWITRDK